jgi:protoheme IX farnesyltransferase
MAMETRLNDALEVRPARVAPRTERWAVVRDYVALAKPGIVLWLLMTAYAGMVLAARGWPGLRVTALALGGLALSAGGAHAVNMWYDRDIDRVMERTKERPVAAGRMAPETALALGLLAEAVAFPGLGLLVNWATAAMALSGYLFYVLIYTMWLKRRTPQNIVIGGAAGAFPPLVGWAAVDPHASWVPALLFLVIFLWTPPHFWSLALYKADDYRRAQIPMMPVARGPRAAKRGILVYTALLIPASLGVALTGVVSWPYAVVAAVAGAAFLTMAVALWREADDDARWARRTFFYSLTYIVVVFLAMVVNVRPSP